MVFTVGKMSAKDIFDNNRYANDPRTQFMNWALMANEARDYPADSIGYMTGATAELNEPQWAARYGFFQMPRVSNGTAQDPHYLKAWGMVTELERRFEVHEHAGCIRLMGYVNRAHMGSYGAAVESSTRPADITATRDYRYKYGIGLNMEQELAKNVGIFSRLGWSDGASEAWTFSDVDRTATLGISIKGEAWRRTNDTLGMAGVMNMASRVHQRFLAEGGTGILAGDGTLSYEPEEIVETYYDFELPWQAHGTLDYQFVNHPAYNRDRGPVHVLAARLHWEF